VTQRLELVAHGLATGMRESIFGGGGPLLDRGSISPVEGRVQFWGRGPEPACADTAAALGGPAEVIDALRGCDFGSWTGRSLAEVGASDPAGVGHWLNDPNASPHGGESLAQLVVRVGSALDQLRWPDGRSIVVLAPLVVRALIVHVLQTPPAVIFRIDVSPLGRVVISGDREFWRLRLGSE
jgi:broad specificity phosphatase PhoE